MALRMRPMLGKPTPFRFRGAAPPPRRTSPPPPPRRPPSFPFSIGLNLNPLFNLVPNDPPPPSDSPKPPLEVCVKAARDAPNALGDCPFCQRILLTLEEKNIPYTVQLVNVSCESEGSNCLEPEGNVPMVKFDSSWVANPDVIVGIIEGKYPQNSLITSPGFASVGSNIYGAFVKFLKSRNPDDGSEQALFNELKALNDHLKAYGPYISGGSITSVDLNLSPKLYHVEVALGHFKKWTAPKSLNYLHDYMKMLFSRPSFVKTQPSRECVINGWMWKLGYKMKLKP